MCRNRGDTGQLTPAPTDHWSAAGDIIGTGTAFTGGLGPSLTLIHPSQMDSSGHGVPSTIAAYCAGEEIVTFPNETGGPRRLDSGGPRPCAAFHARLVLSKKSASAE